MVFFYRIEVYAERVKPWDAVFFPIVVVLNGWSRDQSARDAYMLAEYPVVQNCRYTGEIHYG